MSERWGRLGGAGWSTTPELFRQPDHRPFWWNITRVLLEAAVSEPKLRLSQLPLLASAERRQLLVDWNATEFEPTHEIYALHHWFEQQAETHAGGCGPACWPGETGQSDTMAAGAAGADPAFDVRRAERGAPIRSADT